MNRPARRLATVRTWFPSAPSCNKLAGPQTTEPSVARPLLTKAPRALLRGNVFPGQRDQATEPIRQSTLPASQVRAGRAFASGQAHYQPNGTQTAAVPRNAPMNHGLITGDIDRFALQRSRLDCLEWRDLAAYMPVAAVTRITFLRSLIVCSLFLGN